MTATRLFVGIALSFLALLVLATVVLGVRLALRMPGRPEEDGPSD
ncbi:hypothetical protein [Kitasatospora purpeofusca]|uniref:Histidine kinase n=1 Tax=Kitasatospora purpeofusca TaxID=67352 RepID=A0ABZ1U6G9_9ACTN|nr:hypothetical protein [Kitasatospora purpeofusca]